MSIYLLPLQLAAYLLVGIVFTVACVIMVPVVITYIVYQNWKDLSV